MKIFFCTIVFIITLNNFLFCQYSRDTVKLRDKDQKQKNIFYKESGQSTNNKSISIDFQNDNFVIPLNLKIYSKILTDNFHNKSLRSYDELTSGLPEEDLAVFNSNKKTTQKMLSDIYGTDLIDLKKILESLGITKDQIIALAGILKFLFYHPYLY